MMPKTLQKILGHSNIGITMNLYVHITEDEKHKEIDLVADAFFECGLRWWHPMWHPVEYRDSESP